MPQSQRLDAEAVARALSRARRVGGDQWQCLCPAHNDCNPSLTVCDADDGRLLVHCHAGCRQDSVIQALRRRNLWPQNKSEISILGKRPSKGSATGWKPLVPVPRDAPEPELSHSEFGAPSYVAEYLDKTRRTLGFVRRFETSRGKTFRPLTYCEDVAGERMWRERGFDKPFPIYGLERLAERPDEKVVICEGERAADHAGRLLRHMVCISWPFGAKNVTECDWSPVVDREIWVWPDADEPGLSAGTEVARQCSVVGACSVRLISPPADAAPGWDAVDARSAGISEAALTNLLEEATEWKCQESRIYPSSFDLRKWQANQFSGPAPDRNWLVSGVLPLATPAILASVGGIGKSMLALKLATEVATGSPSDSESRRPILGGEVTSFGAAVVLTAEDDAAEIHRRLNQIDPEQKRLKQPSRLMIVPLPNAGGILPLIRGSFDCPELTTEFESLRSQLLGIPDLKLVVLDPLQAFLGGDANKDPAIAQHFCASIGRLAADTGSTILLTHHFRKQSNIRNPSEARDAVRGTTALVDGVRSVYALWPADKEYARRVCSVLGEQNEPNKIIRGAVVKSNWPATAKENTFARDSAGLLADRTDDCTPLSGDPEPLLSKLEMAIARAATDGKPYTKTGKSGVHDRREELPVPLTRIGRQRLQDLVQTLLDTDRIRQCSHGKSGRVQWLDVPQGPFGKGKGTFVPGAMKRSVT